MSSAALPGLLTSTADVAHLAASLAGSGRFALDLEFLSADRLVPDLALVQLAWGAAEAPEVAAVDPLAVAIDPLVELVASPAVEKILHAAQGDLSLLATLYGVEAKSVVDTQLAAAFAGLGESLGYAKLVAELLGVELDKGLQFTNWRERPLPEDKLRYALDDVRHLPAVWQLLEARLATLGRLEWLREDSARLAAAAARRYPPSEAYRRFGLWQRLPPRQLGVLAVLAEWREEQAVAANRPLFWIIKDRAMLEMARRQPGTLEELKAVSDLPEGVVARRGRELLALIRRGRSQPVPAPGAPQPPKELRQQLGTIVEKVAESLGLASYRVAPKGEIDALYAWARNGAPAEEPPLALLNGWRRAFVGEALMEVLGVSDRA
ncbi:MAG TPA: HRDC domain-containing protein [Thermoanaerobaculia bacterium]|nr:HRDC domain-containing protein [Thermoanaerobaculia bacterium]